MATGTVKVFKDDKRFGFIVPDEGWNDLFFYDKEIDIRKDDRVEYTVEQGNKWPEAKNVRKI